MRKQLRLAPATLALTRILNALEQELIDASSKEILLAARELGMHPEMKGSAAFAGLSYPAPPKLADFFELRMPAATYLGELSPPVTPRLKTARKARSKRTPRLPTGGKEPGKE
jgi:hypothetical protein